jgi:hypothetical protein
MPKKSQETFSFPRGPMPIGKAAEVGISALEAEYAVDVDAIASAAAKRIDDGELEDGPKFYAWLRAAVGESRRVNDRKRALRGLLVSANAELDDVEDLGVQDAMHDALELDVVDALKEDGYDVEDPPEEDDEEDEDEDDGDDDADDDEEDARE